MKKLDFGILCLLFLFLGIFPFYGIAQNGQGLPFVEERPSGYVFNNIEVTLLINKQTWQVELLDVDGKVHYAESQKPAFLVNGNWISAQSGFVLNAVSANDALGTIQATNGITIHLKVEKVSDYGFKLSYSLPKHEVSNIKGKIILNPVEEIYGFGENWNGHLAQRGQSFEIWDKGGTPDECAWMPYFVSTNNYTFSLNYGGLVKFDIGQRKSDELVYEIQTNELEYTLVIGNDIASSVQNFVALTGMPAKPPRWSFQPWFWLMSDPDIPKGDISTLRGEHFLEMIAKLKELDIPVGVTWLEPPWQDARTTFIPNKEFCPDLKGLIAEIEKQGVKTLAWTVPYTSQGASNWDEAVKNSYLVKKPGGETDLKKLTITKSGELDGDFYNYIDYFNPEAFKWWKGQIEKSIDLGIKGFKLDAGQGLPSDGILNGGRIGKDVHNSYALEYNRVFYESLKNKLGNDFLMIPRAAWTGSGAYTNFKWPGDLSSSFANNGLPSSVYSSLSLALSGMPFVSTDIGGFSDRPAPEKVWVRWAQFGAMLPGMQTLHMPWWYSKEALEHYRYLTWLHTDLIPYWETLANVAHNTGTPVCRPLVWNYQDDIETWRIEDEFTVGDYLLVAPFMNGDVKRYVYLPEGTWFDFWDEKQVLTGPVKIKWFKGRQQALWKFPLYIKEGAVIPLEVVNDVSGFGTKYSKGFITLAIWPELNTENEFILDDREGQVPITVNWKDNYKIAINWKGSSKDYLFRIHLKNNIVPDEILSGLELLSESDNVVYFQNSKTDGWFFDRETQKLWIRKLNDKKTDNLSIKLY